MDSVACMSVVERKLNTLTLAIEGLARSGFDGDLIIVKSPIVHAKIDIQDLCRVHNNMREYCLTHNSHMFVVDSDVILPPSCWDKFLDGLNNADVVCGLFRPVPGGEYGIYEYDESGDFVQLPLRYTSAPLGDYKYIDACNFGCVLFSKEILDQFEFTNVWDSKEFQVHDTPTSLVLRDLGIKMLVVNVVANHMRGE